MTTKTKTKSLPSENSSHVEKQDQEIEVLKKENMVLTDKVINVLHDLFIELDRKKIKRKKKINQKVE